jgi:PAS domain S-box-containing protein
MTRFLRWLITPKWLTPDSADARRTQSLLAILIVLQVILIGIILIRAVFQVSFEVSLGAAVSLLGLYLIGRFISYPISRWGVLGFFVIYPFILWLTARPLFTISLAVTMLLAAVLLCHLFYRFQGALRMALAGATMLIIILAADGALTTILYGLDILLIYSGIAILIVGVAWVNERDYQQWVSQGAALRASEDRFQRLLEAFPEMIAVQADGRFRYMNTTGLALLGATAPEHVIGREARRFYVEADPNSLSQMRESDPKKPMTINFSRIFRRLDGTPVTTTVTATAITYDGQLATLLIARETPKRRITDEVKAVRLSLQDDELPYWMLQTVLAHVQDAVVITDTDLTMGPHILYVNAAFCRMTGYNHEELVGSTSKMIEPLLVDLRKIIHSDQPFAISSDQRRRDGRVYTAEWRVFPMYGAGSGVAYYAIILRDMTTMQIIHREAQDREERYRVITEYMSDYAYALDVAPDGSAKIVWLTGAFSAITGYTREEINELAAWDTVIFPDDIPVLRTQYQGLLQGQPRTVEIRLKKKSAPYFCWVRHSAYPVFSDDQRRVVRIYGTAHDISDRVQAEEMLKRHFVQQVVVAELGLLAIQEQYFDHLADYAILLCEQALEADLCEISMYDAVNDQITQVLHSLTKPTGFEATSDGGQVRYALQHRESVVMLDMAQETRFQPSPALLQMGIQTGICVVIPRQLHPGGVFAVYHRAKVQYKDDDVYFLQSVANVLGTFLERQQARQGEQEQRKFSDALQEITLLLTSKLNLENVLNTILEFVAQWIPGHQASTIMLLNAQDEGVQFASQRGYDSIRHELTQTRLHFADLPVIQHIISTGQTLMILNTLESPLWVMPPNAAWIRSYLGVPIILEDQCLGIINVDSGFINAFDDQDAARLQAFASKVAIAVRNSHYTTELERRVLERTAALQNQQATIQAILEASAEAIIATRDENIIFANQATTLMTGYATPELLSQPIRFLRPEDITPEEAEKLSEITATLLRGEVWRDATRIRRKNGTVFDAGVTISLIQNQGAKAMDEVIILRDISTEKALDAQTERFIADAAHELRSPITVLNTRLYLMRRRPELMSDHIQVLEKIVIRMNRLVSDLLDMSRFKQGQIALQKQVIVIQDVLAEVLLLLAGEAEQKFIQLEFDSFSTPLQVLADPHRLHQVFTNLINNAINYTPEHGQVSVSATLDTAATVIIKIQDTGSGIPPEQLPFIFQPFFRGNTKQPGTGLGLSITREIVLLHEGDIQVSSVVGTGTTFTVRLDTVSSSEA